MSFFRISSLPIKSYFFFHSCLIASNNMEQYQCDTEQLLEIVSPTLPCLASLIRRQLVHCLFFNDLTKTAV